MLLFVFVCVWPHTLVVYWVVEVGLWWGFGVGVLVWEGIGVGGYVVVWRKNDMTVREV